jgi:hypothetical protein
MTDPKGWPKYLPTKKTLTARVLRWFDKASERDLIDGVRWYDEQRLFCQTLASLPDFNGDTLGLERAAEVVAALSPRTQWSVNVAGATLLVTHRETMPNLLGRNVEMAESVLLGRRLAEVVKKGPKIQAFAKNLAGDTSVVTVDVHAAYAVGVDENTLDRVGCYDAVASAYRAAAVARGLEPSEMQAVVWLGARRQKLSENRRRS